MDPVDVVSLAPLDIIDDLHSPVVLSVSNGRVTIARYFMIQLRNRCRNWMRVKIARRGDVIQADDVTVLEESYGTFRIIRRFIPTWGNEPIVILILIVIAGDLLLV